MKLTRLSVLLALFINLTFSLAFAQTEGVEVEQGSACHQALLPAPSISIFKGFTVDQFNAVKLAINTINKDIPVEGGQDKTWRVYTQPIMRRKNLYLLRNETGKILAYAAMKDDANYLSWIAVREGYRGKDKGNLARKLVEKILEDYGQFTLDVRANNARAVKFYDGLSDIAPVDKRPGEKYENGEDGLTFTIGTVKN